LVPGSAPVLQFAVLVQSPLLPTQETVAAVTALEVNRTAKRMAIPNLRSALFINAELTKYYIFFYGYYSTISARPK
jgi:hypothetical protein